MIDILVEEDLEVVLSRLEDLLKRTKDSPISEERKIPQTFDVPILIVLVQNECHRIYRREVFCPFPECDKKPKNEKGLMEHI
jgi:hypothetical protein